MSGGGCLALPSRAVSNLDVESKLSRHYSAPCWHQQRNIFHPSSRPPCVEELHAHATLRRERRAICRERRVTIAAPPMPSYPSPRTLRKQDHSPRSLRKQDHSPRSLRKEHRGRSIRTCERSSSPTECCHFSPFNRKAVPTDSDGEAVPALGQRSRCPVPNVPSTLDKHTNWTGALPLPTPEERMKSHSQVVESCLIPINVTGLGFDRDASVRCSLVHSQSVLQRRRKLRRRKTVAGVPRQVQRDLDSDDSPGSRERTAVMVHHHHHHASLDTTGTSEDHLELTSGSGSSRLGSTKDSGCQTEEFLLVSGGSATAPSRRRIRSQRGGGGASLSLSYSAGNVSSLMPGGGDEMMNGPAGGGGARLRSRSLPREGSGGATGESRRPPRHSEDDEDDEELSRFHAEEEEEEEEEEVDDFLSLVPAELKDEEDERRAAPAGRADRSLQYHRRHQEASMEHGAWMESRGRGGRGGGTTTTSAAMAMLGADMMGSCEMSSSSDTFSSPVHSSSGAGAPGGGGGGVLPGGGDHHHKDDHQSSSGNWSGSSSTCPSHASDTVPPPASPPLTGSHCDSELSLHGRDTDPYGSTGGGGGMRTQRAGSYSSAAMDLLEDAGVGTASDGEWSYPLHPDDDQPPPSPRRHHPQDFSPEPPTGSRGGGEGECGSLGCPSFASMATYESSYSDTASVTKPPSDTVSHYSVDTEGYYTSMHFDCGLKESRSFTYGHYAAGSNHHPGLHPDLLGGGMDSLSRRCLSLRKPRAKPSPPQRSSSLRKICSEGNLLLDDHPVEEEQQREPKMCCGQQPAHLSSAAILERKLQLNLSSSSPGGRRGMALPPEESLFLGRRSGEAWAELPDSSSGALGLLGSADAHSFKDEGAVQSDYADLWLLNDLKAAGGGGASDPYRSLSNSSTATGTTVVECGGGGGVRSSQEGGGCSEESQQTSRATTPSSLPPPSSSSAAGGEVGGGGDFKLASSPEKLAGLASPSSGYSSQSETPTSCFPSSAFFPVSPLSPPPPPGGKRKPKVPERKSSLSMSSTAKGDLELPVVAPTHLDLSGLHHHHHDVVSAHRNHLLHPSKPKAVVVAATKLPLTPPSAGVRFMAITPTVLHAVQLRSVSREPDKLGADAASARQRLLSGSRSLVDFKASAQLRGRPYPHSASSEFCESLLLAEEKGGAWPAPCSAASEAEPPRCGKQDGQAPPDASESSAEEFRLQSDKRSGQDLFCLGAKTTASSSSFSTAPREGGEVSLEDSSEAPPPPGATAFRSDSTTAPPETPEASLDEEASRWCASDAGSAPLPVEHNEAKRRDEEEPASGYQSDGYQSPAVSDVADRDMGYESPGVSACSGSQDSKDGSTPDREDSCTAEYMAGDTAMSSPSEDTPAEDTAMSPLSEDTPAEDTAMSSPNEDTPAEDTAMSSPSEDTPAEDTAMSPLSEDTPAEDTAMSAPREDTPAEDTVMSAPKEDTPAEDTAMSAPREDTPAEDTAMSTPREDTPAEDTAMSAPSEDTPAEDTAMSAPSEDTPAEDNDSVFLSPTKTRTTEDLFAMIHRSKRKVLGRKDSGEMGSKTRLGGSSAAPGGGAPATPPGVAAATTPPSSSSPAPPPSPMTPTSQQKTAGNIYRSVKKSSTSNEEFKLLLLRKGSRSEHSYRMSAAEILKSPVTPNKSPLVTGDWLATDFGHSEESSPSPPSSSSSSPLPPMMPDLVPNNHYYYYPKALNGGGGGESFSSSPKAFHGAAPPSPSSSSSPSSRQGRSRIPPPASSSRYGARGRLYAAPMQAISEGEAENSDGSPHDERPSLA